MEVDKETYVELHERIRKVLRSSAEIFPLSQLALVVDILVSLLTDDLSKTMNVVNGLVESVDDIDKRVIELERKVRNLQSIGGPGF